jgi:hypothetical protein
MPFKVQYSYKNPDSFGLSDITETVRDMLGTMVE